MIRLLILSDTHGSTGALSRALDAQPHVEYILHLGDGAADMEDFLPTLTRSHVYTVAGNCDFFCNAPDAYELRVGGVPLFMTHGHAFGVKHGLGALEAEARRRGMAAALFGHTHQPLCEYRDGIYLINPGSLRHTGTYAVMDIVDGALAPRLVTL